MTNIEILEKAIQKAIKNGWLGSNIYPFNLPIHSGIGTAKNRLFFGDCAEVTMLLFNHDFAKALWGEEELMNMPTQPKYTWQYHLQQMVIAEDPIKYIGDNL